MVRHVDSFRNLEIFHAQCIGATTVCRAINGGSAGLTYFSMNSFWRLSENSESSLDGTRPSLCFGLQHSARVEQAVRSGGTDGRNAVTDDAVRLHVVVRSVFDGI